ncbi:E3 ubiquitin-protein ligase NRDP1 elgi [Brevipalpus obovatus]|uniref:E3 ubiquitin-protein ligase NRDP1 elgi n=1 Tax=Brevipalpus obovatus TaxID=246614 RepID=UPI003D9E6EE2
MGYDVNRFHGEVDDELICSICSGVLENPLQAPSCEHAFCTDCIKEWLSRMPTCPVDRLHVAIDDLKPTSRILRNLLCRLVIDCDYSKSGCTSKLKLDQLPNHCLECDYNPEKPSSCTECRLTIPKSQLSDHVCVRDLRSVVSKQEEQISYCTTRISELEQQIKHLTEKFRSLSCLVRGFNSHCPANMMESFEQDEIERWVHTLPRARITRWGGMISTPDNTLQETVRRALIDSGCPMNLVAELMENAHERRWPPGLSTLEIRQRNRKAYHNFVCRKIPGRQAVVVMSCDNTRMNQEMLLDPGLVMIFAHGIE